MRILKGTKKNVRIAANLVVSGGLVIFPTDTVYALGCDPFNVNAVKRLIKTKNNREKPLPILSNGLNHVEKVVQMTPSARKIAEVFWPGPLTLILFKTDLPDIVTSGLRSVGVRIPNHKIALSLISLSGGLLVGTSANKTGYPPLTNATEASAQFGERVDLILDGGAADLKLPSTIVDLTLRHPAILRKGPISLGEILESLDTLPASRIDEASQDSNNIDEAD